MNVGYLIEILKNFDPKLNVYENYEGCYHPIVKESIIALGNRLYLTTDNQGETHEEWIRRSLEDEE